MGKMTLREAAKVFDVSRPTLSKALKSGKITGEPVYRDGPGTPVTEWRVDPAELARVYRRRVDKDQPPEPGKLSTANTPLPAGEQAEIERLRQELAVERQARAVAEALAEERAARIEDLRRMLPAPDAPRGRWFWQR